MTRVVVVEDEQILRKGLLLSVDWQAIGCTVVGEAGNGEAGLMCILQKKPDIVITDIRMPVMDGLEMLDRARRQCRFRAIILTGYSEFDYAKQAITLGVDEYLLKPVDERELQGLLARQVREIALENRSCSLIYHLERGTSTSFPVRDGGNGTEENYYVRRVLEEVESWHTEKLSIEDLAAQLEVSVSYLSRKFKESTGSSFLDFLNQYRLRKAVQLLNTGRYRFTEAADLTGFSSYKHFHSVFTKYTGQTPSEFMKHKAGILFELPLLEDVPDQRKESD